MAKKTLKLNFEGDNNFYVAGIICGNKDFRLCYEINMAMDFNFIRKDDVIMDTGRPGSRTTHSYFVHIGVDNEVYHLISNRDHSNTGFYIPEMKNVDYFIVISGTTRSFNTSAVVKALKKIQIIAGVYEIKHKELKVIDAFVELVEQ